MNERIKELAGQCYHRYSEHHIDLEKFAELIVKECIDIAQDRAAFDGYPPNDVNIVIDEIKEHFGVEE